MQQSGPFAVAGARSKWLVVPRANSAASVRLFCLASAGHGPAMFRGWAPIVGPRVELALGQLPGRESRFREPAMQSMADLVPALAAAIAAEADRPFAIFGHSLGALIAFEVTRRLRMDAAPLPQRLFVSAHRAPHLPNPHPPIAALPDREFVAEVNRRHGGIPPEVAENEELMALTLPSLRADYRVFETYVHESQEPLPCPITAFGGTADEYVKTDDIQGWEQHTGGGFTFRPFEGGHFFVNEHRAGVVRTILDDLGAGSMNGL